MPNGVLVIADISGYTSYLRHAELEPAAELLRKLLDILIDNTRPPLQVSKLEGDAVFSYALEGSFLRGETLVEMIENTYAAFRQALDQLVLNNQCSCNACTFIPQLDLKFFVHYGTFLTQPLSNRVVELVGTDVNLIHRLTKNHITEKTGFPAYVAYTGQAVLQLGIQEMTAPMPAIVETYDHIGDILVFVQDMHEVWQQKQRQPLLEINNKDVLARIEAILPASQPLIWDYITMPEYQFLHAGAENKATSRESKGQLPAAGSYRCIDGRPAALHTIRSWDPPHQYTYEAERPFGSRGRTTILLEPADSQTHLTVLIGKSAGKNWVVNALLDPLYRQLIGRRVKAELKKLSVTVTAEAIPQLSAAPSL